MKVALLCATHRGNRFLQTLIDLCPGDQITVFSFVEDPVEPKFLDDIQRTADRASARFVMARNVGRPAVRDVWDAIAPDLLLAVSWRYMVPREIFERPRLGSFVFHDSMLPAYRGFSPTVWAIANGEDHTGVTLFHMDDAVDAGDIVDQERVPIGSNETIRDVLERTTETYLVLLKRNLRALKAGTAPRRAQDHAAATYCRRRTREDNQIDWARPTAEILNLVRAVARPYSGAYTSMSGRQLQIWAAQPGRSNGVRHLAPGRTRTDSRAGLVEVGTADGLVVVSEAQIVGGEPSRAAEVIPNGLTLGE